MADVLNSNDELELKDVNWQEGIKALYRLGDMFFLQQ